jgi:hypothetical protein
MLRSPKERFLASTHSGAWGKITQGETFEEAIHSAFSQMEVEMPSDCPTPQQACDAHQQMVGARKFMDILCSIHVKQTTTPPKSSKSLDYSAGV